MNMILIHDTPQISFLLIYNLIFVSGNIVLATTGLPTTKKPSTTPATTAATNIATNDEFVGYILNTTHWRTPYVMLEATEVSATYCTDLCGLYFLASYSVVMTNSCICVNDPDTSHFVNSNKCISTINCVKAPTEICGCTNNKNIFSAVYKTEYADYNVSLIDVDVYGGSRSLTIYINVIGVNNRETGERACHLQIPISPDSITFSCEFSARNLNEDVRKIRIGTKNNGIRVRTINIAISNLTILLNTSFDVNNAAVDIDLNGKLTAPSTDSWYYDSTSSTMMQPSSPLDHSSEEPASTEHDPKFSIKNPLNLSYCLNNSFGLNWKVNPHCNDQVTGLKILGIQYRHTIPFQYLGWIGTYDDCDGIVNELPINVTITKRNGSDITLKCHSGFFKDEYDAISRTITISCQNDYQTFTSIPPCIIACLKKPPILSGSVINNYEQNRTYFVEDNVTYCCSTGHFSGYKTNLYPLACSPSGNWTEQKLPDCKNNKTINQNYSTKPNIEKFNNNPTEFQVCSELGMTFQRVFNFLICFPFTAMMTS